MMKKQLILFLFFLATYCAFSQAQDEIFPFWDTFYGGEYDEPNVNDMIGTSDGKLLVSRSGSHVDIMDTLGNKLASKLIPGFALNERTKFILDGDTIYFIRGRELYKYKDDNFELILTLPAKTGSNFTIYNGVYYYTGDGLGLNISFDKGETWHFRDNGIQIEGNPTNIRAEHFAVSIDGCIYLAVDAEDRENPGMPTGAVYISNDYCENWVKTKLQNQFISSMFVTGYAVWIVGRDKSHPDYAKYSLWRALDQIPLENTMFLDFTPGGPNNYFPGIPFNMYLFGKYVYVSIDTKIYHFRSDAQFVKIDENDNIPIYSFTKVNDTYIGYTRNKLVKLNTETKKWDVIYTNKKAETIENSLLGVYGDSIYVKSKIQNDNSTVFLYSPDNGKTWEELPAPDVKEFNNGITPVGEIGICKLIDDKMYVSISYNGYVVSDNGGKGKYYRPEITAPDSVYNSIISSTIYKYFTHEENLLLLTSFGLYISRDKGKSFHICQDEEAKYFVFRDIQHHKGKYYGITNAMRIYRSDDFGETWKPFLRAETARQARYFMFIEDGMII